MSEPINPEFTAIGVISTSLRILKEKISFFGKLIAAYIILGALPTLILYNGVDFTNPAEIMEIVLKGNPFYIVLNLFYYVAYALYMVFVIDRTDAYLNGYSFDDYPYLSRGIKTILPVIGIYFIYTILSVLGFILLIVPGLIVVAGLYVAIPAKLSENISILAALQRSWTLTKGHRLTIWGVILIPLIPILIITYIGMFSMLGDLRETGDISVMLSPAYIIINTAINAVITTFFIIVMAVCYHQIKYENLDVPE